MFQHASLFCNVSLLGQLLPEYSFSFCSSSMDKTSKYKRSLIRIFLTPGGGKDPNRDLVLKKY